MKSVLLAIFVLLILVPCIIIRQNQIQADTTCPIPPLTLCIGLKCPILPNCDAVDISACRFTPNVLEIAAAVVGTVAGIVFLSVGCCYYCHSCCFSSKITPIYAAPYDNTGCSKINHTRHNINHKPSRSNLQYSPGSISPSSANARYTATQSAPVSTELGNTIGMRHNQLRQAENHLPSTRVVQTREWVSLD